MEIRGKIVEINLDAQIAKNGGGTYSGATISFRDKDGKLQEKGFHSNALKYNAALKNGLENLHTSDNFVAQAEKNDKGFWEWKSIAKASEDIPKQASTQPKSVQQSIGGNWQTAEERAQTQVYIVRQSSITSALKLAEVNGAKKLSTQDIILLAKDFEAYVLDKKVIVDKENNNTFNKNENPFDDEEDDVPL